MPHAADQTTENAAVPAAPQVRARPMNSDLPVHTRRRRRTPPGEVVLYTFGGDLATQERARARREVY